MSTMVICHGCQTVGAVNRVTATLRCTCGSDDLDLYEGARQVQHFDRTALDQGFLAFMGVTANSGGTGWGQPMPDALQGWNQYAGPMPGPNPNGNARDAGDDLCPTCHGDGFDMQDGVSCRECGGSGHVTPTTSVTPKPLTPKRPGQTSVPFMGRRKKAGRPTKEQRAAGPPSAEDVLMKHVPGWNTGGQGKGLTETPGHKPLTGPPAPLPDQKVHLHQAYCPNCESPQGTDLVKDGNGNAWWHCPNCGPLANIDAPPHLNPYDEHGDSFQPQQGFQATLKSKIAGRGRSRALTMIAMVSQTNPGLSQREVVSLTCRTLNHDAE
jgi:hypothetical protein